MTYAGSHSEVLLESWDMSADDLDTLTVPVRMAQSELTTYLGTLNRWSSSSLDGNMFLASWSTDDHAQYPTVRLRFVGKKGNDTSSTVRQSLSAPTAVATYRQDDSNTLSLTYRVPTQTITSIDRDQIPHVSDLTLTEATSAPIIEYVYRTGSTLGTGMTPEEMRDTYFVKIAVDTPTSDELVPGQYFRNSISRAVNLFALLA